MGDHAINLSSIITARYILNDVDGVSFVYYECKSKPANGATLTDFVASSNFSVDIGDEILSSVSVIYPSPDLLKLSPYESTLFWNHEFDNTIIDMTYDGSPDSDSLVRQPNDNTDGDSILPESNPRDLVSQAKEKLSEAVETGLDVAKNDVLPILAYEAAGFIPGGRFVRGYVRDRISDINSSRDTGRIRRNKIRNRFSKF